MKLLALFLLFISVSVEGRYLWNHPSSSVKREASLKDSAGVVKDSWAQCSNGTMATGDGNGAYETSVGIVKDKWECINSCVARRKRDESVNGILMTKDENYCWCEHQMFTVLSTRTHYLTCYLPKIDVSGQRCQGTEKGCCTKDNPCDVGGGDCDEDDECKGDLVCGNNNCAWGKGGDCCREKNSGDEVEEEVPLDDDEELAEDAYSQVQDNERFF